MGAFVFLVGIIFLFIGIKKWINAGEVKETYEQKEQNVNEREKVVTDKERKLEDFDSRLKDIKKKIADFGDKKKELEKELVEINNELDGKYGETIVPATTSVIEPLSEDVTSSEIKSKLSVLLLQEKEMIAKNAVAIRAKGLNKRESTQLKKKLLLPFNSEITGLINRLTIANIESTRKRFVTTFDKINKLFESQAVISSNYLELKLQELDFNYEYIIKLRDEKEQQKAIKEQMIDEEKARRELEKEQTRIAGETKRFSNELSKMLAYLSKSTDDIQTQIYSDKIKELEQKISQLEEQSKDVTNRLTNTRAGHVYIISNIGSFGDNIYKIGMTKRLEPLDRVKELSSASVPFEFDVHAVIFSSDAPALENHLHKVFANKSVNKVNSRKEFFHVDIKEIEKEVLDNFDATVSFTEIAKAEEFRRSQEIEHQVMIAN